MKKTSTSLAKAIGNNIKILSWFNWYLTVYTSLVYKPKKSDNQLLNRRLVADGQAYLENKEKHDSISVITLASSLYITAQFPNCMLLESGSRNTFNDFVNK